MDYLSSLMTLCFLFATVVFYITNGEPVVPALFIFGDSIVDVGNNNNLHTVVKADFFPYGRDFVTKNPTGRMSNGKLAVDYASEFAGFTSYQPAYLNLNTKGSNILNGANFASSGSGYHDSTSIQYHVIPLMNQLEFYKDCQEELVKLVGKENATSIISGAAYLLVDGSGDFAQNYFINPILQNLYTPYQFSDVLIEEYYNFIQNLYALGARKIGVTTLPPIGCMPFIITKFGYHSNKCVETINNVAIYFNKKLNLTTENLIKKLPGVKLVIFDIYQPLYELIIRPSDYGLFEARKACCGTGLLEVAILCNKISIGTCADASKYVFWDSFHTTEATNKILMDHLIPTATSLLYSNQTVR
ncbi:GDSL esterase/lipase At5g22810 [Medicago truncatula]|uniref:GDSL esterase/lipase At5g22810 n=1 Tax=Medicago truncatula TaxID=3880 RepID=UPI00196796FD|nr:GDSL esterase/lipase At5g22810 [Medicago truncatula]